MSKGIGIKDGYRNWDWKELGLKMSKGTWIEMSKGPGIKMSTGTEIKHE